MTNKSLTMIIMMLMRLGEGAEDSDDSILIQMMMMMIMCALHTTTIRANDATNIGRDIPQRWVEGMCYSWLMGHMIKKKFQFHSITSMDTGLN